MGAAGSNSTKYNTQVGFLNLRYYLHLTDLCFRYYLHFDAKKGLRYIGDIAIDDISLSPECFGLNIPESELNGYNYGYYTNEHMSTNSSHVAFANQTCKLI